jgi:hypothetical protein
MKKGDGVANDEDDDAVRTKVLKDRLTATLCKKELFFRTQYTPHIRQVKTWGGRIQTVKMTH